MNLITRAILTANFGISAISFAAQTQPAGQVQSLEATITNIQGLVQVQQGPDKPWTKAEVGMKVAEQGSFRTGPHSAVRFTISDDQSITLDRLGVVKLVEAVNDSGKERTQLGMKYGRTRFDIEAAGREHDASIASPSSTLAVRGTKFLSYDQRPFHAEAVSFENVVNFKDGKKQINFGSRNGGKAVVNTEQPNAASVALAETTSDPTYANARSEAEGPLIDRLLTSGATVGFDREAQIKVVTGGVPPTDQQLIPALPGVLNFVARWNTDADLNFSVSTPGGPNNGGELLYPIGALATNSSGGKVAFDHRGGPHGGIEVIYFPTANVPSGAYALGLTLVRGSTTTAQVDVFLNGQRQDIFAGSQGIVQSAIVDVAPPIPGFVDGTLAGVVFMGFNAPSSVAAASTATTPKTTAVTTAKTTSTRTTTATPVKTTTPKTTKKK